MILFAVSTDTSTGELFIAGVMPGILIGLALMFYVWFYARRNGLGKRDGEGRLPLWPAFKRAWLADAGGRHLRRRVHADRGLRGRGDVRRGGGQFIYRKLSFGQLSETLHKSVMSTAVIMFVDRQRRRLQLPAQPRRHPRRAGRLAGAGVRHQVHVPDGRERGAVPHRHVHRDVRVHRGAGPLLPVALKFGGAVHFGIIMVVNLALGMITPPFGVNLCRLRRAKLPLERLIAADPVRGRGDRLPDGHHLLAGLSLGLRDVVYGRAEPPTRAAPASTAPDGRFSRLRAIRAREPEAASREPASLGSDLALFGLEMVVGRSRPRTYRPGLQVAQALVDHDAHAVDHDRQHIGRIDAGQPLGPVPAPLSTPWITNCLTRVAMSSSSTGRPFTKAGSSA